MSLEATFNEIATAMAQANTTDGHALASQGVDRNGLIEQIKPAPSQITVWEKSVYELTLRFKWRWYDPSQAFSIRPDINILTLELLLGDEVLRREEHCYEDQY